MPNSVLEAIEEQTVAALAAIAGITSAKAVPVTEQFRQGSADDQFVAEMPDGYPGFTVSLNDDEIEIVEVKQSMSSSAAIYRVPVYAALFVTTDGTSNDVRKLAWQFGELTQQTMLL